MNGTVDPTEASEDRLRRTDVVRSDILHRLAAALDRPAPSAGLVPPLWHWTSFLDSVPTSQLGPDGHPRGGGLVESPPYPRRMFAGARLTWTRALPSDAPLQRIAEVGVPVAKDGRAGPMAFVTVRFRYLADGVEIAQEEQDLVYLPERKREEVAAGGSNEAQAAATGQEADGGEVPLASVTAVFDTPALFRFSALTYNSHRIHYDEPYVTGEEGYPGLVVHGPLLAIMLADLVRGLHGDDALVGFTFKARAPAFVGESLTFEARPADTQVNDGGQERAGGLLELTARRGQVPLMTATAQLRPGLV